VRFLYAESYHRLRRQAICIEGPRHGRFRLLRSPHTIELYDFGVADDGSFYYVMELLDGFNLDALVKRFGPLPAERAKGNPLAPTCKFLGRR
jgi:serine/threonine protein kinase